MQNVTDILLPSTRTNKVSKKNTVSVNVTPHPIKGRYGYYSNPGFVMTGLFTYGYLPVKR